MTNFRTAFGATMWMAVSALMMLAALEPVSTAQPELAARTTAEAAA